MLRVEPRVYVKFISIYKMESIEIMTGIGVLLDTILFPIFKTVHPVGLIDTLSFVEIRFLLILGRPFQTLDSEAQGVVEFVGERWKVVR